MKRVLISALSFLVFVGCARVSESEIPEGAVVFKAYSADNAVTKTVLQEDGSVLWCPAEDISVFYGSDGPWRFTGQNKENAAVVDFIGSLEGIQYNDSDYFLAAYPYSEKNACDGQRLVVELPEMQQAVPGSFDDRLFLTVARSENRILYFYNVCGGIKFSVTESDIRKVTFKGNAGETLAGTATVSFGSDGKPAVDQVEDGKKELALYAPDGETFQVGKWYYIVSLPTVLSEGYTMTFHKVDGTVAVKSGTRPVSIKRAFWGQLEGVDASLSYDIPDNEIWYTSTDGKVVEPTNPDAFDATIVSNTYIGNKGVIRFDKPVTRIVRKTNSTSDNAAFGFCQTLATLSIPSSVREIGFCAFYACNNLTSIALPDYLEHCGKSIVSGSAITTFKMPEALEISGNPTARCLSLQSFTGPYATSDGRGLIKDDTFIAFAPSGMEEYSVPDGVSIIGYGAFEGCRFLKKINLPQSVTELEVISFEGCFQLSDIVLPENLAVIRPQAFRYCSNFRSIKIPQSVSFLAADIFEGCASIMSFTGKYASEDGRMLIDESELLAFAAYGLEEYSIPEGITTTQGTLGYHTSLPGLRKLTLPSTLSRCTIQARDLQELYCYAPVPPSPSWWGYIGMKMPSIEGIYVPAQSVEAYKTAQYWSDYADRIFPIESGMPVPEAVDLGLPSGLKWASFNLGASRPEEAGFYYAWGETSPKKNYYWTSYKWCEGSKETLTKYNEDSQYGVVDNKTTLDLEDDAAHVNLGSSWRMPTHEEQGELRDYCNWIWATENGVNGYRIQSRRNGNSIFLPVTGSCLDTDILEPEEGHYWSSSLWTYQQPGSQDAYWFRVYKTLASTHYNYGSPRYWGRAVRPVTE